MRAVYGFFICWLLFECKTFELLFVAFCSFGSFHHLPILSLHIEGLYKVG